MIFHAASKEKIAAKVNELASFMFSTREAFADRVVKIYGFLCNVAETSRLTLFQGKNTDFEALMWKIAIDLNEFDIKK